LGLAYALRAPAITPCILSRPSNTAWILLAWLKAPVTVQATNAYWLAVAFSFDSIHHVSPCFAGLESAAPAGTDVYSDVLAIVDFAVPNRRIAACGDRDAGRGIAPDVTPIDGSTAVPIHIHSGVPAIVDPAVSDFWVASAADGYSGTSIAPDVAPIDGSTAAIIYPYSILLAIADLAAPDDRIAALDQDHS